MGVINHLLTGMIPQVGWNNLSYPFYNAIYTGPITQCTTIVWGAHFLGWYYFFGGPRKRPLNGLTLKVDHETLGNSDLFHQQFGLWPFFEWWAWLTGIFFGWFGAGFRMTIWPAVPFHVWGTAKRNSLQIHPRRLTWNPFPQHKDLCTLED